MSDFTTLKKLKESMEREYSSSKKLGDPSVSVLVINKNFIPGKPEFTANLYSNNLMYKYQQKRVSVALNKMIKIMKKLDHDLKTYRYWEK